MDTLRALCRATLLVAGISLILPSGLLAFPGVTGKTNKSGGGGCAGGGCHGTKTGTFTISGPTTLKVNQSGTYTITFPGNVKTGTNVAASDGTLAGVTTEFNLSGGELTFTAGIASNTWTFKYTPTTAGSKTLYAACVLNGHNSGNTWNHAADFAVTATPLTSVEPDAPRTFSLGQNYPNPFNPATTIEYTVAKQGRVTLNVYAMSGTLVATLVNATQEPGSYRTRFDGAGLASGVYIYRLSAGDLVISKKLVLLK